MKKLLLIFVILFLFNSCRIKKEDEQNEINRIDNQSYFRYSLYGGENNKYQYLKVYSGLSISGETIERIIDERIKELENKIEKDYLLVYKSGIDQWFFDLPSDKKREIYSRYK